MIAGVSSGSSCFCAGRGGASAGRGVSSWTPPSGVAAAVSTRAADTLSPRLSDGSSADGFATPRTVAVCSGSSLGLAVSGVVSPLGFDRPALAAEAGGESPSSRIGGILRMIFGLSVRFLVRRFLPRGVVLRVISVLRGAARCPGRRALGLRNVAVAPRCRLAMRAVRPDFSAGRARFFRGDFMRLWQARILPVNPAAVQCPLLPRPRD